MITLNAGEIIYSIEDKIPKQDEVVLVLIDGKLQDEYLQWFRTEYQKQPLDFYWLPAKFSHVDYGYPIWLHINTPWYRVSAYVTHWKYINPPPEILRNKEYS